MRIPILKIFAPRFRNDNDDNNDNNNNINNNNKNSNDNNNDNNNNNHNNRIKNKNDNENNYCIFSFIYLCRRKGVQKILLVRHHQKRNIAQTLLDIEK